MISSAIDFGTSGTTYAFAFNDSKDDIIYAKWPDSPNLKNSTEIILNEKMETIKFGDECQQYLGELSSSEEKFYHFTDIKMKLYDKKTKIKATNDDIVLTSTNVKTNSITKETFKVDANYDGDFTDLDAYTEFDYYIL